MQRQDKLDIEELKKYRSFIVGIATPAGEQAGFVSYFAITKARGPGGEGTLKLVDEIESPDILALCEGLKWLTVKFDFRRDFYRSAGDFIFGNAQDYSVSECLRKHSITIHHSSVIFGQDEEKPFMTLLPEINRERVAGLIIVDDESLLSLRLKDELLQNPAAIKYGDSPALQSLCYAYFGWKELIAEADRTQPRQTEAEW